MEKKKKPETYTYTVTRREMLQLCPVADGWRAVYLAENGTGFTRPVLALALVRQWEETRYSANGILAEESDKRRELATLGAAGEMLEVHKENSNFAGYLGPGEDMEEVFGLKPVPGAKGAPSERREPEEP